MRRIFLLLLLPLPAWSLAQQSLLQDALFLAPMVPPPSADDSLLTYVYNNLSDPVVELLAQYAAPGQALEPAQLDSIFQENPFLRLRGEMHYAENADDEDLAGALPDASLQPPGPLLPSLPITRLAWGLSEFLAERTKEEMNIAFFYRLKKFLAEQEDAQLLFPETLEDLNAIDMQIYDFSKYLQSLRLSFYQDLNRLPEGLLRFLDRHKAGHAERELLATALQAALYQAEGRHPLELLHSLAAEPAEAAELQAFAQALQVLDVGVYDSFWEADRKSFLPGPQMRKLGEEGTFRLYLALLYQRLKNKGLLLSGQPACERLRARKSELLRLRMALLGMASSIERIEQSWTALQGPQLLAQDGGPSRISLTLSAEVASGFAELMRNGADLLRLLGAEAPVAEYMGQALSGVSEMMLSVESRDYGSAVVEAAGLLAPLCADSQRMCVFVDKFLLYGSFMAAALEAESAAEVAQLIEQYALPAGSASIKKHARLSVSVNAYAGGFYGYERLPQLAGASAAYAAAPIYGITAPLGLNLNLGLRGYGSLSLHGSLVDVGAITSFLLQTGASTASLSQPLPELRLENILAPGIALVYGLPGQIPLSAGLAYQRGPQLRGVRADPNALAYDLVSSRGRIMGFVAVDIPLVHLYTSSGGFRVK